MRFSKVLRTAFFVIITLSSFLANAQKATVIYGERGKTDRVQKDFIQLSDGSIIQLEYDENKKFLARNENVAILTRLDKQLRTVQETQVTTGSNNGVFLNFVKGKNVLYLYGQRMRSTGKSAEFYLEEINMKTLQSTGKRIELGEVEKAARAFNVVNGIVYSADSTSIAFYASDAKWGNEEDGYHVTVFDGDLNLRWKSEMRFSYSLKNSDVVSQFVTNSGRFGVMLKVYNDGKRKDASSYETIILSTEGTAGKVAKQTIGLKDKLVSRASIADERADGTLEMFGVYSKNSTKALVSGYFLGDFNAKTNEYNSKLTADFPDSVVQLLANDVRQKGKDEGLGWYIFKNVYRRENGTVDYVLEYSLVSYSTMTSGNGHSYSTTSYSSGPLFIINVNNNTGASKFFRIPKAIATPNQDYVGFVGTTYKNNFVAVYLDNEKNIERDLKEPPIRLPAFGNLCLMLATLDENGKLKREALFNCKDQDFVPMIALSRLVTPVKIAFYGVNYKAFLSPARFQPALLTLK